MKSTWMVLAALALAGAPRGVCGAADLTGDESVRVIRVSGRLLAGGKAAGEGATLQMNQRWETPAGSESDIRVGSRAVLRLKPGTRMRMVRRKNGEIRISLEKGALLNAVRPGEKYRLETPVAAATIRGTVFFVENESAQTTYMCLCRGRMGVSASKNFTRELTRAGHESIRVTRPAGKKSKALPCEWHNHTDAEIAELTRHLEEEPLTQIRTP